jgi:hypothetical protein
MKIRKPLTILAVASALLPATIFPVAAQGLIGKSIEGSYTVNVCFKSNGICTGKVPRTFHFYVGSAGHLYEFTGLQKGKEYTLGVRAPDGRLFTVQDNTLAFQFKQEITATYSVHGTSCSVALKWPDNDHRPSIQNLTCVVTDGPPPE